MKKLEQFALAPTAFIQFTAGGQKLYEDKTVKGADGADETVDDLDRPIGVVMVAPGSTEARAAEDAVAKAARERMKQERQRRARLKGKDDDGMPPEYFVWLANEKACRMVTEFKEFEYNGKGASEENTRAFLNDPKWQVFADQIRSATGDYDAFMQKDSAN